MAFWNGGSHSCRTPFGIQSGTEIQYCQSGFKRSATCTCIHSNNSLFSLHSHRLPFHSRTSLLALYHSHSSSFPRSLLSPRLRVTPQLKTEVRRRASRPLRDPDQALEPPQGIKASVSQDSRPSLGFSRSSLPPSHISRFMAPHLYSFALPTTIFDSPFSIPLSHPDSFCSHAVQF
jgi:hypothetical protein